jgi:transketolase
VSTVFFNFLRFDRDAPRSPANDRFVLSKGHAAPILWGALAEAGAYPIAELKTLRRIDSELEGHPTPRSRFIDVATGSLGQGLSVAVGMAIASRLDEVDNQIFTLLGDGEAAEGAVWEAAALAAHESLGNLTAFIDVNRLGQSEPTMYGHNVEVYERRFDAFGWHTQVIDGHNIEEIISAVDSAIAHKMGPSAIIARTLKGKGISFMEDKEGWHGVPVKDETQLEQALQELGDDLLLPEALELAAPSGSNSDSAQASIEKPVPDYELGQSVATRVAYGTGLAKLGQANPLVVALDGDCKNSTFSLTFRNEFPERFVECYIAEQNMIGVAAGLASLGKVPFASSFACFLTRAYDFIRMAAISQASLKVCGSHAGVSIGEDGPSQMGLEDLAMMRAIAGSTVLYPSDGVSAESLVNLAAETEGIVYIRTSRPKTPVIYENNEVFEVGGSKVLRSSQEDQATVIGAGVTLHEALKAYDELLDEDIKIRVIDLYSVKPVDKETVTKAAAETGLVITVEDHYPEGGIGEAVLSALSDVQCKFKQIAVSELPRSGPATELLDLFGINAAGIVRAVKENI